MWPSRSHGSVWPALGALGLLAISLTAGGQQAPRVSSPVTEFEIKAAFLLNFMRFVTFPSTEERPPAPLTLCVLGEDPFGPALDQVLDGESVGGRPLTVRRFRRHEPGCSLIYISSSERGVGSVLEQTGPGVLTVGEGKAFLEQGGMIAFTLDQRHVRFDVNLRAVTTSGLQMSSRLLKVARMVRQ